MAAYKATSVEFHRNGVCGDPFSVVHLSGRGKKLSAVIFDTDDSPCAGVAVICPTSPTSKYRGDWFAPGLRDLLSDYDRLLDSGLPAAAALARLGTLVEGDSAFSYSGMASTVEGR